MLEEYFQSMINPSIYNQPVSVKNYDDMSEDEQFDVIERALNGDLRGVIEVTPKDMELYNRRTNMSRTGYVTQAESEAFRQKWAAEHPEEMRAHQEKMAALNLNASSTFSSGPMESDNYSYMSQNSTFNNYEPYSQVQASNNLNVGYTPQNYYTNPYGSGYNPYMASPTAYNQNYYTNMYNPYGGYSPYYGYNQAPAISNCFDDPISKFAWSKIDQISQMYHTGQLSSPYGGYSYYQPHQMTEEICATPAITDNNLQVTDPMMRQHLKMENAKNFFRSGVTLPAVEEAKREDVYISIPVERSTPYYGYYSQYYSMSPVERAMSTLPPYAQTAEYQEAARQYAQNQQNLMDEIGRTIFQYGNLGNYDDYTREIYERNIEDIREQYKANLMIDNNLPIKDRIANSEKRKKAEALYQSGRNYLINHMAGNDIPIDQFKDRFNMIMNVGLQMSPDFQLQSKYVNPNQSFVEYVNGFNKYSTEKAMRDFASNARKAYMGGYDRENYRRAIVTDNPNEANSMIGFKNIYDPVKRQMNQVISPYEGLADKYAAKRDAFIRSSGMYRGGTGQIV